LPRLAAVVYLPFLLKQRQVWGRHRRRSIFAGSRYLRDKLRLRFLSPTTAGSHLLPLNDSKSGKEQPDLGMLTVGGEDLETSACFLADFPRSRGKSLKSPLPHESRRVGTKQRKWLYLLNAPRVVVARKYFCCRKSHTRGLVRQRGLLTEGWCIPILTGFENLS